MREAIIEGKLEVGVPLAEMALAKKLNMSRTPIREAITILEKEGFLQIVPGKGAFVSQVSLEDVKEINELRKALEPLAAESAIDLIPDEKISEAKEKWLRVQEALSKGEIIAYEEVTKLDGELHNLLIENCTNTRLQEILLRLNFQIRRYQLLSWKSQTYPEDTIEQHLEILSLLQKRNLEQLKSAIQQHIEFNKHYILANFFQSPIMR